MEDFMHAIDFVTKAPVPLCDDQQVIPRGVDGQRRGDKPDEKKRWCKTGQGVACRHVSIIIIASGKKRLFSALERENLMVNDVAMITDFS